MTFRAILDDGKEHKPVLRMMTGEMTPRQIDKEYCGAMGKCPDCEGFLAKADLGDSSTFAAAVMGKDRSVLYRRGVYLGGSDDLLRQMHFTHKAGYLQNGLAPCNCKTKNQLVHTEAVEAIAHQYRKDSPEGFKIDAECQFVKPGTPPETYRPDIVVLNQFGGKNTCIEYQRSPESFENFVHRHIVRASEWGSVIWFFDKKIWERKSTCDARDWLFDNNQTFYLCWVDEVTLQLQVEEGTFASAIVKTAEKRRLKKFVPQACSEADIINEWLLATGQETDNRKERVREQVEPTKADRLQGFNLVKKSEEDRRKNRELFETLKRQKAAKEQEDRRRREYHAKMNRIEKIQRLSESAKILGEKGQSTADLSWNIDSLDDEAQRLTELQPEAVEAQKAADERERMINFLVYRGHDRAALNERSNKSLDKLEDKELARLAQIEAERREEEARKEAEWRARQQQIAEERQAKWERENAKLAEQRRREADIERQWHPIKFSEPTGRTGHRFALNLRVGDRIRPRSGYKCEKYEGLSSAGYSTDRYTYSTIEGWQVWKGGKDQ